MKKLIGITIFSCILFFVQAQDKKIRIGLAFSNGLSFMSSDNSDITPQKVGYSFDYGLSMDIHFDENYALGTGFMISHPRAARENTPALAGLDTMGLGVNVGARELYTFTYVSIPTTFKLKTAEVGYFRYFGEFGIVNSFRIRGRLNIKESELSNEDIVNPEAPILVQSTFYNASLKVGGGFEYTISDKTAFLLGLYFYNGFVNILDDGDNDRTVLRTAAITTGFLF